MTVLVKDSPFNDNLATITSELGSNLYLYQILEETPNGVMVVDPPLVEVSGREGVVALHFHRGRESG